MSLRNEINSALKEAMKEKAQLRLSTLRLINAAIKDRDIAARAEGVEEGVDDSEILAILGKMTRQRQESAKTYEEAGRLDLSERELSEIQVIEYFLPRQLNGEEIEIEVTKVIDEQGASSIRDMGRVMACLKERFTGQMDFGSVGPIVKKKLSN
ncbi:MAG: glutamyl-tRNA amidotransferase [Marinovum sp.]|nr:glutamyl-tRNA amidotransferase [Marinovum sp.]